MAIDFTKVVDRNIASVGICKLLAPNSLFMSMNEVVKIVIYGSWI